MKKKKVLRRKITRSKPSNIFGLISLIVLVLVVIGGVIGVASKSSYLRGKASQKISWNYCSTLAAKTQCQDLTANKCKWVDCPTSYSVYGSCPTDQGCRYDSFTKRCFGDGGSCIYNILSEDPTLGCGPTNYTSYGACWVEAIKDNNGNEIKPGKCVAKGEKVGYDGVNVRYCCITDKGYLGYTVNKCDETGGVDGPITAPTAIDKKEPWVATTVTPKKDTIVIPTSVKRKQGQSVGQPIGQSVGQSKGQPIGGQIRQTIKKMLGLFGL